MTMPPPVPQPSRGCRRQSRGCRRQSRGCGKQYKIFNSIWQSAMVLMLMSQWLCQPPMPSPMTMRRRRVRRENWQHPSATPTTTKSMKALSPML